jgi:hypothetical protein
MKITLDIGFEKRLMNIGLNWIYRKRAGIDLISGFVHQVVVAAAYPDLKIGPPEW